MKKVALHDTGKDGCGAKPMGDLIWCDDGRIEALAASEDDLSLEVRKHLV